MNEQNKLIGAIVGVVIILGLLIWYMASHPAPVYAPTTSENTPTGTATGPGQVNDSGDYYNITGSYPTSTVLKESAGASADAAAVATLKSFVEDQATQFKQENVGNLTAEDIEVQGLGGDRVYTLDVEYETYQSAHTVSYLFQLYADTMGAHPNTYYRSFTFDKATGKELTLDGLFTNGATAKAKLSSIARTKLPAIIAARENVEVSQVDTEMLTAGTDPASKNTFNTFYIDGSDFVVFFQPYDIGPYVLGTTALPIPLTDLADILKPEYK